MTSISLPGQPGLEPPRSRELSGLFGTVRRGEDGRFGRRLLRIAPFVVVLHAVAITALLAVRPTSRPVAEDPPKVVFLRAVPQSAPAAPRAAPAHSPKAKTARNRARMVPPREIPKELPPETPPPETAQGSEASPTEAAAAPAPASTSTHGLGGSGDAPVGVGEITRAPDVLFSPRPAYPPAAKSMGITGTVVVRVVVDVAGHVEPGSARILRSVAALDGSALEAISRWRFSGSRDRNGHPVRVILDVPVAFSLR